MTKTTVDKIFTLKYNELFAFTETAIKQRRKNFNSENVIAELYLKLVKKKETFKNENEILQFSRGFIRNEVNLFNSTTNKNERTNVELFGFEKVENFIGAESWQDFKIKIHDHEQEVTMEVIIDLYKKKEDNKINQRLLEMYMNGQTCREVAEILGISKDAANREILKMKKDILIFGKSLKKVII